jgi:hypothetical protein
MVPEIWLWEIFKSFILKERFQNQLGTVFVIPTPDMSSHEKFLCLKPVRESWPQFASAQSYGVVSK